MVVAAIHLIVSVGWVGAIAAFLVMSLKGTSATDAADMAACARGMQWIGWWLILPMCIAAFVSGVAVSLLSPWGLIQHYWVILKQVLMIGAAALLFLHMSAVNQLTAAISRDVTSAAKLFRSLSVDAAAALLLLFLLCAVSIWKPAGRVFSKIVS